MILLRAFLLSACVLATALAQAWDDTGHMVIAAIAYDHLTPTAKAEVDRLIKIGGDERSGDFISAAPWADDIRRERRETAPWHFINLHFREDGQRSTIKPEEENVVWAIAKFKAVLRDKAHSDSDRAEALRFLEHFVGDIHQPLHDSSRDTAGLPEGDKGGNAFSIEPPADMLSERYPPKNLHSLWDAGCGLFPYTRRPLTATSRKFVLELAQRIEKDVPEPSKTELDRDPMSWAQDGQKLAINVVYKLKEGSEPSEAYLAKGRETCESQAALAGYRLAAMLNSVLGQ